MSLNEDDLKLIGGEFIAADLPPDKSWMNRYFTSNLLRRFLVYYVTFSDLINRVSLRYYCQLFIDHTGNYCTIQLLCSAAKKIRTLEEVLAKAERERNLEEITNIKLGSYIFK